MNLRLLVALENANKVYPRFVTLDHMGTPLKNQNFENMFFLHVTKDQKIGPVPMYHQLNNNNQKSPFIGLQILPPIP